MLGKFVNFNLVYCLNLVEVSHSLTHDVMQS